MPKTSQSPVRSRRIPRFGPAAPKALKYRMEWCRRHQMAVLLLEMGVAGPDLPARRPVGKPTPPYGWPGAILATRVIGGSPAGPRLDGGADGTRLGDASHVRSSPPLVGAGVCVE
jgi:hypothetical protein